MSLANAPSIYASRQQSTTLARRAASTLRRRVSELLIILALVVANGVFAGAEIAVLSVRKTRLRELAEAGSQRAQALLWLRAHPERFLATVQVAITVISATAAAFGGSSVAAKLAPVVAMIPGLEAMAHDIAMASVIGAVSYLSLVLGELVPKSLALRSGEGYALAISAPLRLFSSLTRPLVWLLTASSNVVLRPFGDHTSFSETRISLEELRQLVEEATLVGTLDSGSGEIAARALEFGDLTASSVMVPRPKIVGLSLDADANEVRATVTTCGRSRLPVYQKTPDSVVGYVTARDLMAALLAGHFKQVSDHLRPIHYVPPSTSAVAVLKDLQRRRMQLAIVVDEHGGVAGMLTLEDLIEELVGDVLGEDEATEEAIVAEADGAALVVGATPIREVNRRLGLELPEDAGGNTIAGYCIALAGDIPTKGERFLDPSGVEFEVVAATARTVGQLRLHLPKPPSEPSEASPLV